MLKQQEAVAFWGQVCKGAETGAKDRVAESAWSDEPAAFTRDVCQ